MKFLSVRSIARVFAKSSASTAAALLCLSLIPAYTAFAQDAAAPIVLTGADRRPATSLNGEWGAIVDPYFNGLFSFHHEEKKNGWFLNQKAKPGDPFPIEYDFAKASKLKVPGDWNTQRESLLFLPLMVLGQWTESLRARGRLHKLQLRCNGGNPYRR